MTGPESSGTNPLVWISYVCLWIVYIGVIGGGIAWIIYRLVVFLRNERERELSWADMASDDQFKDYLKNLANSQSEKPDNDKPKDNSNEPQA